MSKLKEYKRELKIRGDAKWVAYKHTMFNLEVVWNREFNFVRFGKSYSSIDEAKAAGENITNSGDGARVKKYRVVNTDSDDVVYPVYKQAIPIDRQLYTCSFCEKQEQGKPLSYLINPSIHSNHKVALRPDGWDWDIIPVKFTDLWSCGCCKINK